jgi:hypothetical protein
VTQNKLVLAFQLTDQFVIIGSVLSLKAMNEITGPGGQLYASQQRLFEAMKVWTTLFDAGEQAVNKTSENT